MKMDTTEPKDSAPWLKRIGWLLLIWAASVATLGLVAYGMRELMRWVGLK